MQSEGLRFWIPVISPIVTSLVVLYMGVELQEKREHDKQLLTEVRDIRKVLNESAVVFARVSVKVESIETRVTKLEDKIEELR